MGTAADSSSHRAQRKRGPHRATDGSQSNRAALVVGLDGRKHDADALALSRMLQPALGGDVVMAHVLPPAPLGRGVVEYEAMERQAGSELLASAAATFANDCQSVLIDPWPVSPALAQLAHKRHAELIVLGSSHRGTVGWIVPGGVASQLLVDAECAIAIAPVGYVKRSGTPIIKVGVAYDASPASARAVSDAVCAATRLDVPLYLYYVRAVKPTSKPKRSTLEDGLKRVPPEVETVGRLLEGEPASALAGAASADGVGLLFAGSRGHGPLREILLGGVAGALMRNPPCPLVLIPPGAVRNRSART